MTDLYGPPGDHTPADGRFYGVAIGVVTNNKDPDELGRVKLKLPRLADEVETNWARVAVPMAADGHGYYFLPESGDQVLVAFEHGNPELPYVVGALWPPVSDDDDEDDVGEQAARRVRPVAIKSSSGHVIRLTDTDQAEQIEIIDASGKNSIVISTKDNQITIAADADIVISSAGGRLLLRGNGVEIASRSDVTVKAESALAVESGGQLNIKGQLVNIN